MKTIRITVTAAVMVASGLSLYVARAQQSGLKRTDLQQHDLSIPGREVVQARVEIVPGSAPVRHFHPGEEIIYVLEGTLEYQIDGQQPVTLKAGQVYFIPARAIHSAKNVGNGPGGGARHLCRRKGEAAHHRGQVSALLGALVGGQVVGKNGRSESCGLET